MTPHPKADLLMAIARGETIQVYWLGRVRGWHDCSEHEALKHLVNDTVAIRVKQKTIRIGDMEVSAPVIEPLEMGQWYWTWNTIGDVTKLAWDNDDYDNSRLKLGLLHLTEAAARENMEAVIKLLGGEV